MMPGEGEGGRGRLIVTQEAAEGDLGSPDLNARAAGRARTLLGTEQSGLHAIGGRTGVFYGVCPPPPLLLPGAGGGAPPPPPFAAGGGVCVVGVGPPPRHPPLQRGSTAPP